MPNRPLMLQEEVLLLALHSRRSRPTLGAPLQFALAAALLAELLQEERLRVDPAGKRPGVVPGPRPGPTGQALLDACLDEVTRARAASLQAWVARGARWRGLKERVAASLCERGILRAEETKVLRIFSRTTYPEIDPAPARQIRTRISRALESASAQVDPRTVVLISLAFHAGLLASVLEPGQLKDRRARLRDLIAGEPTGPALRAALDALTAVLVASTAAAST
jgi:hypothetical protein